MTESKHSHLEDDDNLPSIEEICNTTWETVYKFIYFKVQNREEAEDITQETYIKAISHLRSGKVNPNKYVGFLKTVALNILRDAWRKKKRRGTSVHIDLFQQMDASADDPAESSAQRSTIEDALSKLNKEQRTVIDLRILKGYSVAETARLMNKKEVTIRVMQHRSLRLLADILNDN